MLYPHDQRIAEARYETIRALNLDTPEAVRSYDNVIALLETSCGTPISIFTVLTEKEQLFKSVRGLPPGGTPIEQAFCNWTISQENLDESFTVEDASLDKRFAGNPLVTGEPNIRFYAGAPVLAPNNIPIGAVCIIDIVPRKMTNAARLALQSARELLEDALRMQMMSIKDHLTGLYNRRYFDDVLESEARRAYRHIVPLAAMMIDIDHFKRFNDTYGHQLGDDAIKKVASILGDTLRRAGDIAARYGGEEFVILLPETDAAGAEAIAQRILSQVSALNIAHSDSETGHITVSIGASVAGTKSDLDAGASSLIAAADKLLYHAKSEGRNRAVVRNFSNT